MASLAADVAAPGFSQQVGDAEVDRESVVRLHLGLRLGRCAAGSGGSAGVDDGRSGPKVASIAAKERRMESLTDEELRDRTAALRARLAEGAKASGG